MKLSCAFTVLLFLFSSQSQAQKADDFSISKSPKAYSNAKTFSGFSKHGPLGIGSSSDEFPMMTNPQDITLQGSADITGFSHPIFFKSGATNPKYTCKYPAGTKGKLVYVDGQTAAVQVQCPSGQTLNGDSENDIVFVKLSDVKLSDVKPSKISNVTEKEPRVSQKQARLEKKEADVEVAESLAQKGSEKPYFSSTEEYLKCYPTAWQDNYDKHIKAAVELASKEFKIALNPVTGEDIDLNQNAKHDPIAYLAGKKSAESNSNWIDVHPHPDVLKCLFRKESLFDPSQTSPTGAVGLGQQVSENITEIRCMIYGCKGRSPEPWAKGVMESYQQKVNQLPVATKDFMWRNSKTGKRCKPELSTKMDAYCPIHSITATALYQLKLESIIRKNFDRLKLEGDFEGDELVYVSAIIASGHNAGEGNVSMMSDLGNPLAWESRLVQLNRNAARRKEVKGYLEAMKACISGSKTPMYANDKVNTKDPSCIKGESLPTQAPAPTNRPKDEGAKKSTR